MYTEKFGENKDGRFSFDSEIKIAFAEVSVKAMVCEPQKSNGFATESDDYTESVLAARTVMAISDADNENLLMELFSSLIVMQIFTMTKGGIHELEMHY